MKKRLGLMLVVFGVQGCYPTAEMTEKFPVAVSGTVSDTGKFQDCMLDHLNPMEGWLTNRRDVQQEIRSDRTTIDTSVAAGTVQLSRTEIFKNGKVQIRIADYINVSMIDRSPERNAFSTCLNKFQ